MGFRRLERLQDGRALPVQRVLPPGHERVRAEIDDVVAYIGGVALKPRDLVKVSYSNGASLFWEVTGVFLGAENQESVIELVPVNQKANTQGPTRCPAALLDVLSGEGTVTIYAAGA